MYFNVIYSTCHVFHVSCTLKNHTRTAGQAEAAAPDQVHPHPRVHQEPQAIKRCGVRRARARVWLGWVARCAGRLCGLPPCLLLCWTALVVRSDLYACMTRGCLSPVTCHLPPVSLPFASVSSFITMLPFPLPERYMCPISKKTLTNGQNVCLPPPRRKHRTCVCVFDVYVLCGLLCVAL